MSVATRPARPLVPAPTENPLTLAVLGRPALAFTVYGTVSTQGSHVYKGHRERMTKGGLKSLPVVVDDSAKLKAWRNAVAAAALAALPYSWTPLDGPVVMDLIVSLERKTKTPKTRRTVPATAPDLDKLARAVNDGICTTVPNVTHNTKCVVTQDSRIVAYRRLEKMWVRDPGDPESLRREGAIVRIWPYPESMLGNIDRSAP